MRIAGKKRHPLIRVRWAWNKRVQKARRAVARAFFVDRHPEVARSVIVAGTGRSGTTWLADMIAGEVKGRIMFEPFHPELVPEYGAYNYFQYMRPFDEDEGLSEFTQAVLSGRLRNRWVDREIDRILPRMRIIKEIRACLLLRWMHERFPEVPIVFLIRNPCGVVASRIKLGWATDDDIAPFLCQAKLLEDFLTPWLPIIESAATDEEKHTVIWCVSNAVPLLQFRDSRLPVVFFEDMVLHPQSVMPRLFTDLGVEASGSWLKHHGRPSTTSTVTSAIVQGRNPVGNWRDNLSQNQVSRVMRVVADFGLDMLYADDGTPSGELPPGCFRLSGSG